MGFFKLIFFWHFLIERQELSSQHLTCHIWKDNEIVVIAQNFKELLNFYSFISNLFIMNILPTSSQTS